MRNRMYGGVRGRKTKVGRKLLHFPPTRFPPFTDPRNTQSTRKIVEDYFHDFDTQAKAGLKPMASTAQDNALRTLCSIPQPRLVRTKLKSVASTTVTLTLHLN